MRTDVIYTPVHSRGTLSPMATSFSITVKLQELENAEVLFFHFSHLNQKTKDFVKERNTCGQLSATLLQKSHLF